jgi:hypothetical protein
MITIRSLYEPSIAAADPVAADQAMAHAVSDGDREG